MSTLIQSSELNWLDNGQSVVVNGIDKNQQIKQSSSKKT